jgi:DNA repair protein SbcC/Rad50
LKVDKLTHEISNKEGSVKTLSTRVNELSKKDEKKINQELLLKVVAENIETLKRLRNEKSALDGRLQENERMLQKVLKEKDELRLLEKEAWKWNMLSNLIGDARGNAFSNMVQEMTLRQLFAHANLRLQKLTDRYLLIADEAGTEDIEIIDRYMGNTRRIAKSLSGGETFLVSLSLALGLSDLASRNVRLDSLFIDEGFGTLDPDTLSIAITALEKLQAESNKTIGVISHVEALKERIGCQIRLHKSTSGWSTIEVVG